MAIADFIENNNGKNTQKNLFPSREIEVECYYVDMMVVLTMSAKTLKKCYEKISGYLVFFFTRFHKLKK